MTETRKFSEAELNALEQANKTILLSVIEDKTTTDVFGSKIAGMAVYKKLIKEDIIFFTEEDEDFTPMVCLTEKGKEIYDQLTTL
jgi:hypothetical protein